MDPNFLSLSKEGAATSEMTKQKQGEGVSAARLATAGALVGAVSSVPVSSSLLGLASVRGSSPHPRVAAASLFTSSLLSSSPLLL